MGRLQGFYHFCGLILLAIGVHADPGTPEKTTEAVLQNGLDVIIREDHRAPVVEVEVIYRVGSVDEKDGKTGLAHMLEHMMFKGTAKVPAEQFSSIVAHFGGEENAFTTEDYTGYYQIHAADRLPLALELEADRMQGLSLSDTQFRQEHRVVMEERRWRVDDNPDAVALERFNAVAWQEAAYRRPTIGWMRDIAGLTMDDVRQWYHTYYAPNNAVLLIVGDVNPLDVMQKVHHFFDALKSQPLPAAIVPAEEHPPGERHIQIKVNVRVPLVLLAFNTPGLRTAAQASDVYALTMLAGILDQGDSSRIQQDMVHGAQTASSADASYSGIARGDTLFEFSGLPAAGHTLQELLQGFQQEIVRAQTTLATPEEMQRVLAQIKAAEVFSHDSLAGETGALASFAGIGLGWRERDAFLEHLAVVTPQQIQAVARHYLVPARKSVAEVEALP